MIKINNCDYTFRKKNPMKKNIRFFNSLNFISSDKQFKRLRNQPITKFDSDTKEIAPIKIKEQ